MALNYIWIFFILGAFVVALSKWIFFGDATTFALIIDSTFSMSKTAFDISIGLTGTLALWMGLMSVGEKGGAVQVMTKLVGPFFSRIFPDVPKNHPAISSMMMNFSANMLGLDNAATPLGLKAMKELQEFNKKKDTASNPMIMFLVLNTSGLTLIPITVMMYRAELGAANPTDVFIPILLATSISSLAGLLIVSVYQKINLLDGVILSYIGGLVLLIVGTITLFYHLSPEEANTVSSVAGNLILLSIICSFVGLAAYRKINAYDAFIEGAKEGFKTAVTIIPYLVAILVAIGMFRASGALEYIMDGIKWAIQDGIGIDAAFVDALPVAFMKPLSGSGARGVMLDIMNAEGADSFAGKLSSMMQGATDTTFYIIAVYFGSVNIRKTRYAITCGLFADFMGVIAAIFLAYLFF
ncbi:nucleoside recognition domain-containing protein [Flammeovirga aprica]|uniref:Spore maturation protein n=1 Tax=Flammeovirga aprica JL-4 TaxID=694437 RepID=A0A7X9XB95_9BACT|nr:spore maturation protein [Flammeovirga aprica]NME70408.1 spore maturation protein [Flammeovirga aprica JL-4]